MPSQYITQRMKLSKEIQNYIVAIHGKNNIEYKKLVAQLFIELLNYFQDLGDIIIDEENNKIKTPNGNMEEAKQEVKNVFGGFTR